MLMLIYAHAFIHLSVGRSCVVGLVPCRERAASMKYAFPVVSTSMESLSFQ
jgi:hypothetical protein